MAAGKYSRKLKLTEQVKRKETDYLGEVSIPADALYGIHAWRSAENFPGQTPFQPEWYRALGIVKLACYQTIMAFRSAALLKYPPEKLPAGTEDGSLFEALALAAEEVSLGKYAEHFIVPAMQGGAGTSANMNMNEILSNVALLKLGYCPGEYRYVHPIAHANLFQSTNDVMPTALKVALMQLLGRLEDSINNLRASVESREKTHRHHLRIAYTQMQQAVPSSYGMLFGAYSDALSRDWWRVSKCLERIKVVNLGGGATGSGMAIPRYFVMEVATRLQKLTNLPLARGDNLSDTTQNLDSLVEVHAILKSHAVNLEKIAADLRLLSSELHGKPELSIPARQTGSSIMPGKVNPVIPEFVIGSVHKVYSNDVLVSSLCGQACLDLNAYLPVIGHAMIDSLNLLINAGSSLQQNLLTGFRLDAGKALENLLNSPSISTALIPHTGYEKAAELAQYMTAHSCSVFEANKKLRILPDPKLKEILQPEELLKLGYSLAGL